MQCRSCGAEIADKALICYRCGTATTEAKHKPVPLPRGGSRSLVATVIAIALLVGLEVFIFQYQGAQSSRMATGAVVAIAILVVALRAYARRR